MLVAVHQPNFLPWLGWFDKLARADVFILLDTVAHQRTGSNYTNRVQILSGGAPHWITVPVMRGTVERSRIDQLRIADDMVWRRKLRATLEQSYGKAEHFAEMWPVVAAWLTTPSDLLCEFNIDGIVFIATALGLATDRMVRASAFAVAGRSTDLLVALVRAAGGDTYLAGGGSGEYQDDRKFADAGIAVHYQDYSPAPYPQLHTRAFVPGLSAIDALMNCGHGAARLLHSRVVN